jgi:RHS repeat-associated protein
VSVKARDQVSNPARSSRHALGRARRALAPRPALRATVARRPEAAEHDRPQRAIPRGSSPHTDHLGSTDTISDSNAAATTQHFDPFGAPIAPPNPEITRVGFTGQDQDVDLGFTDMKGRIYDPLAGRFTSADPVMQAPFWSQGLKSVQLCVQ